MRRLLSISRRLGRTMAMALVTRARGSRARAIVAGGLLLLPAGCKDFLDVNTNPNGPQEVSANLYLAPMLHWMVTSPQFDGRFVGRYAQEWTLPGTSLGTWDRMGYDASSDNGGQQWRDVYFSLGQNLVDMTTKAEAEERWDLLGVARILKAWGWQVTTDLHGEIIIKEAIDQTKFSFNYDSQEFAYEEIQRLLTDAITLLQDLQRRPHQVAEAGLRHAGAESQPLLQQGIVQAGLGDRAGGPFLRQQRRRCDPHLSGDAE
jgi:Starch-binding associating with outer membrane